MQPPVSPLAPKPALCAKDTGVRDASKAMKMEEKGALVNDIGSYAGEIFNPYLQEWKDGGGRIVGYACVATPREFLDAAGVLPYRIRGLGYPDKELADAYLARFNCGFCRACLQLGLDGSYDFLDGLVETNGCDHLRGMFENWQYVKKLDFFHYLHVPHLMTGRRWSSSRRNWSCTGRR
jgi:benzoyl-CoA reductase/2-hydroxyglutaryl-CoA dehydratase subunit BcrC/BadD/HgdB